MLKAKTVSLRVPPIESLSRVTIGHGLLEDTKRWQALLTEYSHVLVVCSPPIAESLVSLNQLAKDGLLSFVVFPDGDTSKSLTQLSTLYDEMVRAGCDRQSLVMAIGGGSLTDLVGFAAATFMRGVDYMSAPTTLLAQVDAAVGGKVGINLSAGKNLVGAFYHPKAVWADLQLLQSLPHEIYVQGMAEVMKYGLLSGTPFFEWLLAHQDQLACRSQTHVAHMVEQSIAIKCQTVTQDPNERLGLRACLNLGHTFAHAIEQASEHRWSHGQSVSVGLVLACDFSKAYLGLSPSIGEQVRAWLSAFGLPISALKEFTFEQLLPFLLRDKKVVQGEVQFIALKAVGEAMIQAKVPLQWLEDIYQQH